MLSLNLPFDKDGGARWWECGLKQSGYPSKSRRYFIKNEEELEGKMGKSDYYRIVAIFLGIAACFAVALLAAAWGQ
jgi:hypothetical protein